MEQERRSAYRFNKALEATLDFGEGSRTARLFVMDISPTGMRATCRTPLAPGQQFSLQIRLSGTTAEVQARVVWQEALELPGVYAIGCEFQSVTMSESEKLKAYLASQD